MTTEFEYKHNIKFISLDEKQPFDAKRVLDNRSEATKAGKFLKASGISDAIIDFKLGFLGEMGNLRNEIKIDDSGFSSRAGIILEWIDPNDLRHLNLAVCAGRSEHKERYISATLKEIPHYKVRKHEPLLLKIALLPLEKEFEFDNPVSRSKKMRYKKWLREKILNYELVWGE